MSALQPFHVAVPQKLIAGILDRVRHTHAARPGTAESATWIYRGNADEPSLARTGIRVPTGFAAFPKEMPLFLPPRRFLEQDFNLVHYSEMPRGGHFACLEQPQLFVEDVRVFFRKVRS